MIAPGPRPGDGRPAASGARGRSVEGPLPGATPPPAPPDISRYLGRALRVGAMDSLNSKPLLEALPECLGPAIEIVACGPDEVAARLRQASIDVGLVPVVEYLTGPREYRIVPGVAISSYGPVESMRLFHRKPLRAADRVALDASLRIFRLQHRLRLVLPRDGMSTAPLQGPGPLVEANAQHIAGGDIAS